MTLWLVLGAMTAVALALLLRPLLARRSRPAAAEAHDVEVYRQQLAEIVRDRDRGLLTESEAKAAEIEIERRLLRAADGARAAAQRKAPGWAKSRVTAGAIAILLPVLAIAIYVQQGQPGLPGAPFASREQERGRDVAALQARIAELQARVEAAPHDADAWLVLAQALRGAHQFAAAADAFAQIVALGRSDAPILAAQGEMLTLAAGGVVTPAARAAFQTALNREPREPRARYYVGLAALQAGEPNQALDVWLALEADSAPDAPWLPILRQRIRETAAQHDIDVAARRPAPADGGAAIPGPSAQDQAAAEAMSPEDRERMIRGMVDRLAARLADEPDDLTGWRRLARSYSVLGEHDKAIDAYQKALALAPEDRDLLLDYGEAILAARGGDSPDAPLPPEFVPVMERLLAVDGKNAVALWYLGLAALQANEKAAARDYWERLLVIMPKDAPERAVLERRIAALAEDGG